MASLEFAEPCLMVTGESDEWTDDDDGALHPLSFHQYTPFSPCDEQC